MKKKVIALFMAGVMAGSLAACGGGSDGTSSAGTSTADSAASSSAGSTSAEAPASAGGDNTLTVWCWDPAFNIYAMNEAAKVYQKDHPEVTVNVVEILSEDIETKITTAATAGDYSTLPDIFLMQDNSYQKYVANFPEVFTSLNDSGINFDDFGAAKVAYSTVDDTHYGVPFDNGAAIQCLRTDVLEQAGYTVDDFTDITWDRFIELGKVVKEKTNLPLLTQQAGAPDLIMMMLQSCGSSMFNEDGSLNMVGNPALQESMEIYKELVAEGILTEVTDWDQYVASINNGTVAGIINGCWIMGTIQVAEDQSGLWEITNLPKLDGIDGATNYSNNGGSSWAVSSNCQDTELAFDFLKSTFAGSTEFYDTILPASGALATYLPAGESAVYAEPQPFYNNEPVFSKITEFAGNIPSNITGAYYYDARDAVGVALTNMIQSGQDIEAGIQEAQDTVEFNMG